MTNALLIHGMWQSGNALAPLSEFLSNYVYTVAAPTLPNHYRQNQKNRFIAEHSLTDYRDFILDQPMLGEQTVLIGHGMGGLIAQLVAATIPVKAVILVGSFGPKGVNHLYPGTILRNFSRLVSYLSRNRAHRPSWLEAQFSLFNNMEQEAAWMYYDQMCHESGRAFGEMMLSQFDDERASQVDQDQIKCPMLILAGGQDKLVPPASSTALADYYPGSEYRLFSHLGHMMFDETNNGEFYDSISEFIVNHRLVPIPEMYDAEWTDEHEPQQPLTA